MRSKYEADLDENQFGFRNAMGSRAGRFALNILLQIRRDQRKDVFLLIRRRPSTGYSTDNLQSS